MPLLSRPKIAYFNTLLQLFLQRCCTRKTSINQNLIILLMHYVIKYYFFTIRKHGPGNQVNISNVV